MRGSGAPTEIFGLSGACCCCVSMGVSWIRNVPLCGVSHSARRGPTRNRFSRKSWSHLETQQKVQSEIATQRFEVGFPYIRKVAPCKASGAKLNFARFHEKTSNTRTLRLNATFFEVSTTRIDWRFSVESNSRLNAPFRSKILSCWVKKGEKRRVSTAIFNRLH